LCVGLSSVFSRRAFCKRRRIRRLYPLAGLRDRLG
jgi:hypothetical protein